MSFKLYLNYGTMLTILSLHSILCFLKCLITHSHTLTRTHTLTHKCPHNTFQLVYICMHTHRHDHISMLINASSCTHAHTHTHMHKQSKTLTHSVLHLLGFDQFYKKNLFVIVNFISTCNYHNSILLF